MNTIQENLAIAKDKFKIGTKFLGMGSGSVFIVRSEVRIIGKNLACDTIDERGFKDTDVNVYRWRIDKFAKMVSEPTLYEIFN